VNFNGDFRIFYIPEIVAMVKLAVDFVAVIVVVVVVSQIQLYLKYVSTLQLL
jgi:hypothetical protein